MLEAAKNKEEDMDHESKSVENRLLAALAHGSIVAQGIGILVGVLVYITQRDKSRVTTHLDSYVK